LTVEQQFAEKLHAYTLPRSNVNTRVKDLVDMVLLFESGKLNALATAEAFKLTFERRSTHEIPLSLPAPPLRSRVRSDEWSACDARVANAFAKQYSIGQAAASCWIHAADSTTTNCARLATAMQGHCVESGIVCWPCLQQSCSPANSSTPVYVEHSRRENLATTLSGETRSINPRRQNQ